MHNGYKKGVSIVELGFFTSDTCYKERNGNLTISRNMIVEPHHVENDNFRREQIMSFHNYIVSKVYEQWGPVTEETGCDVNILPFTELKGDSKNPKISVTFTATVFRVNGKEEKHGKQLSFNC